jgi:hypothetical protein
VDDPQALTERRKLAFTGNSLFTAPACPKLKTVLLLSRHLSRPRKSSENHSQMPLNPEPKPRAKRKRDPQTERTANLKEWVRQVTDAVLAELPGEPAAHLRNAIQSVVANLIHWADDELATIASSSPVVIPQGQEPTVLVLDRAVINLILMIMKRDDTEVEALARSMEQLRTVYEAYLQGHVRSFGSVYTTGRFVPTSPKDKPQPSAAEIARSRRAVSSPALPAGETRTMSPPPDKRVVEVTLPPDEKFLLGRRPKKAKGRRKTVVHVLQLSLSQQDLDRIEVLRDRTGIRAAADVIRRALSMSQWPRPATRVRGTACARSEPTMRTGGSRG